MALPESYLQTTKNLQSIINSIIGAKSPERFTNKFLEDLGFTSSNDRLYIGVFKALGLLDEGGVPTQRYHELLDQSETGKVLALCIQDAYSDLFSLKRDAQNFSLDEVKGKFKTLTQGAKSENIISLMGNTFKALCDVADWTAPKTIKDSADLSSVELEDMPNKTTSHSLVSDITPKTNKMNLHYNIQIHLPETTNMSVYDAIFQSIKKHLI